MKMNVASFYFWNLKSLMNLTGACRNCLAKWIALAAWDGPTNSKLKRIDYAAAKQLIYGDSKIVKTPVTPEEMARIIFANN